MSEAMLSGRGVKANISGPGPADGAVSPYLCGRGHSSSVLVNSLQGRNSWHWHCVTPGCTKSQQHVGCKACTCKHGTQWGPPLLLASQCEPAVAGLWLSALMCGPGLGLRCPRVEQKESLVALLTLLAEAAAPWLFGALEEAYGEERRANTGPRTKENKEVVLAGDGIVGKCTCNCTCYYNSSSVSKMAGGTAFICRNFSVSSPGNRPPSPPGAAMAAAMYAACIIVCLESAGDHQQRSWVQTFSASFTAGKLPLLRQQQAIPPVLQLL